MTLLPVLLDQILVPSSKLRAVVKSGLGALKKADRKLIARSEHRRVGDSVDLDAATRKIMPDSPRWDYLMSVPDITRIVGLEPHPARDAEIALVIRKRQNAIDHLRGQLKPGQRVGSWFWVTRGKVGFGRLEKAHRILDQNGIMFVGRELKSLG